MMCVGRTGIASTRLGVFGGCETALPRVQAPSK